MNDKPSGLGAKRLCTFQDGTSLVEEIIDFQEGHSFKMELSEFTLPLKSMFSEMGVREVDSNTSDLYMKTDFVVKGGPIGWLMGSLIMKPMMKGVFGKLLSGLAYYSMTGKPIETQLPTKEELELVLNG